MTEELSRVERVLSDGLSLLERQAPDTLRPNVLPRGYDDRQLRALCAETKGAAAIAAAAERVAERASACGVCGAAGTAVAPDTDRLETGQLRESVDWLIQRHSSMNASESDSDDDGEDAGDSEELLLRLAPRWRLDLAARALVIEAAPYLCPCCVVATRPELLFALADAAAASGGTGTPAASALDAVVDGYAAQERAAGVAKGAARLSLQDAASLAHTLQLMAGGLPPLSVQLSGGVALTSKTAPKLIASLLGDTGADACTNNKKRKKDDAEVAKPTKKKPKVAAPEPSQPAKRSTRGAPGRLLGTLSTEQSSEEGKAAAPKKKKIATK